MSRCGVNWARTPLPRERKTVAAQETFVEELRSFLEEVKCVAPLWNPNLDDGVVINFAPLWHASCLTIGLAEGIEDGLGCALRGRYDWAHFAMHLWPERVIPKCAT